MTKVSAMILAKNEEKNIVDCIESLAWCDEILVIDDYSEDRTDEVAKRMGAKVYRRLLDEDFSKQRNYGISKCSNEWIFSIDADERVTEDLQNEIRSVFEKKLNHNAFLIKRDDIMWGRKLMYGETGNLKFIRLAKKNNGRWIGRVHEKWVIDGKIGEFSSSMIHFPHQGISEFLREINLYSDIRSKELKDKKIGVKASDFVLYPLGKFTINYFVKLGFLDGVPGLIVALIMSFHSFLVRGKLWFLNQQKEK